MRVALSFWIAGAAYVVLEVVTIFRFVIPGPDSWPDYLFNPLHFMGLLPPIVASLVALLLRRKSTIVQFIAAGMAFLVVAPATTFAVEWIGNVLSSHTPNEGFYSYSVMLAVLYLQIPQLVVAIIACALISAVQAARRSVREMSA
jgi:hypothetical protein